MNCPTADFHYWATLAIKAGLCWFVICLCIAAGLFIYARMKP